MCCLQEQGGDAVEGKSGAAAVLPVHLQGYSHHGGGGKCKLYVHEC